MKIHIYIVWVNINDQFNFFEAFSCLRDADSLKEKLGYQGIPSKTTLHILEIKENYLETVSGDYIKNLKV
ncbi:MAG TPA: hypothetical protein VF849_00080 [Blattabacteriaceae bacterium]